MRSAPKRSNGSRRSRTRRCARGSRCSTRCIFDDERLFREPRALRRLPQQLPERRARTAARHSDHARARLHGSGAGAPASTVRGVAFPGHFLMRAIGERDGGRATDLILDPFNRGSEVDEVACRALLAAHVGADAESAPLDPRLLRPCTGHQMLARMLNNLKRTYVELRSFPRRAPGHEPAAARRPVAALRAARPRAAGLSPRRLLLRAARPAALPRAQQEHRRGGPRRRQADLVTRQDAQTTGRGAELTPRQGTEKN